MEFTRQQLHEFNVKGFTSVSARYARCAEKMIEKLEAEVAVLLQENKNNMKIINKYHSAYTDRNGIV